MLLLMPRIFCLKQFAVAVQVSGDFDFHIKKSILYVSLTEFSLQTMYDAPGW